MSKNSEKCPPQFLKAHGEKFKLHDLSDQNSKTIDSQFKMIYCKDKQKIYTFKKLKLESIWYL